MECKECSKKLENNDSEFCPSCLQKKSDFELCIDLFSDNKPRKIQKKIPSSPKRKLKTTCINKWKCSNCDIMVSQQKCSSCNKISPLLLPSKKLKKKKKKKKKKITNN